MKIYLVGGAVRDQLLDLPVSERDWVVVGATSEQMVAQGFRPVDAEFPVFLHPETGDEYALARTEEKTGPGYKGFRVEHGPEITLEQDLLRRDLTINALAKDEAGALVDICSGREDLDKGLLRHITPAFAEDPVRLLRIARFAAKLGRWGFRVAHSTHWLMKQMATSPDLAHLKPERVWREMTRAMEEDQPWRFFEVLHACGALIRMMPEVDQTLGQSSDAHKGGQDPAAVSALKRAVGLTEESTIRIGVFFYYAANESERPDLWLKSLRAERDVIQLLKDLLSVNGNIPATQDCRGLLDLVGGLNPLQQPLRYRCFLLAAEALWPDVLAQHKIALATASQVLATKPPATLYQQGLQGKALGDALWDWRVAELCKRLQAVAGKVDEGGS
ncbi:MAG: rhodanese [Candidatus Thiodiazotropha sp. (ex Monitilora ramsayi)]|nr:rhodanese [Candidatus Thiodiazotropha sp. (ex Monitilora ramsayi)]